MIYLRLKSFLRLIYLANLVHNKLGTIEFGYSHGISFRYSLRNPLPLLLQPSGTLLAHFQHTSRYVTTFLRVQTLHNTTALSSFWIPLLVSSWWWPWVVTATTMMTPGEESWKEGRALDSSAR